MRLSETITIYLASGAPFGVYNYLRCRDAKSHFHNLLQAIHTTMLWPLAAAKLFITRRRHAKSRLARESARPNERFLEKIDQAHREFLRTLFQVIQLTQVSADAERAKVERASCAAREITEKYIGLTLAAAESDMDGPASAREMELYRVAGVCGEELLLAGRCVHRRNAARLITHQARARTELLHALADVREITSGALSLTDTTASRHLSAATVRFYGQALNLLSLLEDTSAVQSVSRLMDAECARLRRLEALCLKGGDNHTPEEESCTAHSPRSVFINSPQTEALNQG